MQDIDLVYLWVDGSDPAWIARHDAFTGKVTDKPDTNCKGRYANNDELKYSLRSIEKYAPWIHQIFIITDSQTPDWLDTSNPKIKIVDHSEIMPAECLPCFSSRIIEHHLHNVPGLAERFIYANDDMLICQPVVPETFFAEDGLPIIRFNRRPFRKLTLFIKEKILRKRLSSYVQTIQRTAQAVEDRYHIFYGGKTHHNIDAYLKSTYKHVREVFNDEIEPTLCSHVRTDHDLQRNLYSYVALAEKKAHLLYVDQHTSFRFHIDNHKYYEKFRRYNPVFLCMNDSEFATDDDRQKSAQFLAELFPDKSMFEK